MRSLSLSSSFFLSSHLLYSTLLYSVTVRRIKIIDRHHMLSCKSNNFWIKKSERKHRRIKKNEEGGGKIKLALISKNTIIHIIGTNIRFANLNSKIEKITILLMKLVKSSFISLYVYQACHRIYALLRHSPPSHLKASH